MFEIFIILAKYLFIVYMCIFLLCGFCINLAKEGAFNIKEDFLGAVQRIMIMLFHITAFAILVINDEEQMEITLIFGLISLLYIMLGCILLERIYKKSSPVMYNGVFFLTDIGLVMLTRLDESLASRQFIWCLLGLAVLIILPPVLNFLPRLDRFKVLYAVFGVVLLMCTLIFGSSLYGSTNWISIGPVAFQPSEVVKLLFVFFLASALSQKPDLRQLIVPTAVSAVIILCLVGQRDLGSALIFSMTFLVVVYIATSNILYLLGGFACGSLAAVVAYFIFSHVRTRVNIWLDPWSDIEESGYQIAQSLFAVGSYGLFGSGFTRGYADYIPVVERDFIFSAICEEFGVLFGIGVILIFVMIFLEGVRAALYSRSRYLTLLSAGLTALLTFQTFLIIGGDIKFVPLTGVTLPFVSYGGTSITMSFVIIAIIQWIYMRNDIYKQDKSPEEYTPHPVEEPVPRRRRRRRSAE